MSAVLAILGPFGDAVDFLLHARETRAGGQPVGGLRDFGAMAWTHLQVVLASVGLACLVALPVGLWLGHLRRGGFVAVTVSNVGRAVPSLALIAVFIAFLGVGFGNVTLALALLAIPPILTNTYVGVTQVDREVVDAAVGQGLTGAQVVREIELPLALPLIFGGLRTSVVNVVATATIAPVAGVVTLGDPIFSQAVYGDEGKLAAAIAVALMAIVAEVGLGAAQRAVTPRPLRGTPGATPAATTGAGAAGGGAAELPSGTLIQRNADNAKTTLTIGSKNFTEQKVLGEIYAQALQAAGYTVKKELNLGDEQTALKALKGGTISAYPEYTGTALLSFFDVQTDDLPKDPKAAYDQVKSRFEQDGIVALAPTPFTSSNEVAVTGEDAAKFNLRKISDLQRVAGRMTLYGSPECRQRRDCLLGLQQTYGLKFKAFKPVDVSQRSTVLSRGQADVSIVFTTDPQNRREKFVLLEDDKGIFPPYNSTLLVTQKVADAAGPDMAAAVEKVNAQLTATNIQELNARVDLDKDTPADAARAFLVQFGFVGK